ncbi:hypothetical protein [Bacillus sp. 1P02SD]
MDKRKSLLNEIMKVACLIEIYDNRKHYVLSAFYRRVYQDLIDQVV